MFQFTTETIVNSNVDSSGKAKFSGANSTFSVLRAGNFKKSEVISLYKHPASAAVTETYIATIPIVAIGKVYRLVIDAKLSGSANSEWANEFVHRSKTFNYEVIATATTPNDLVAAFKVVIDKEMNMSGFTHFTITNNTAGAFTLTASNEYIRFKSVEVQLLLDGVADPITGAILTGYNNYTKLVLTNIGGVKGAQGFGTTTWLTKNLRLPTIDRTNYTAIGQDELPQAGGTYNQYTITTSTARGFSGMGAVGQPLTSVTTHVFYVLDGNATTFNGNTANVVTEFETAMTDAGLTDLITISGSIGLVISGDATITKPATGTSTTQYTVTGATGVVSWTNTTLDGVTTANTTGILSVTSAATTITASDAGTGKTATFVVTIA